MYRILFAALLLSLCETVPKRFGTWNLPTSCQPRNSQYQDSTYSSIANILKEVEAKLHEVCSHFPNFQVRDIYTEDKYQFVVNLAEFGDYEAFDVRIKHRTMCVVGHVPRKHPQCDLSYISITVLPDFLNFHGATWSYVGGNLVVSIPYKYDIAQEVNTHCYGDIDDTLIYVRRSFGFSQ